MPILSFAFGLFKQAWNKIQKSTQNNGVIQAHDLSWPLMTSHETNDKSYNK